jgi:hypothetical protein
LDTFWLKIEQFWPFEEVSILSNGGYLEKGGMKLKKNLL